MGGRLAGRVALVTGGSRGIGAAIARGAAAEGARVIVSSRKQDALDAVAAEINAELGESRVVARACHCGKPEQIAELVAWAEAELGGVDILVNNAATNPFFGPLMQITEAAWDKTFEVNLKGYFMCAREVARRLMARKQPGSIINVASVLGLQAAPFQGAYGATKAAVISLTKTLAHELGGAGIRVNAIAPGLVDTKFASAIVNNDAMTKVFTDRTAARRFAQPEEIVGAVVFLASNEASYVTGHTLTIDGGYSVA